MASKGSQEKLCSVEGCGGKVLAKNFCCKHYYQFKRHGAITDGARRKNLSCHVEECERPHYAKGYCSRHYQQLLKKGPSVKSGARRSPKIYCAVDGCKHTVFSQGLCRMHYIKMRALQMLAEAHPERVRLQETSIERALSAEAFGLGHSMSYDDQLQEAYAFIEDR